MKARPLIIAAVVCSVVVLGIVGAVIHGIATETQNGQARDLKQLSSAVSELQVMVEFVQSSKIWSFPYEYPVEWRRMKSRPQFHWRGKGVPEQIEPFLRGLGAPVIRHVDETGKKTTATFILTEDHVFTEGEVDLINGSFSFQAIHLEGAEPSGLSQ